MFFKIIKHSLKDTSLNFRLALRFLEIKGVFKVSFKEGGFV